MVEGVMPPERSDSQRELSSGHMPEGSKYARKTLDSPMMTALTSLSPSVSNTALTPLGPKIGFKFFFVCVPKHGPTPT